jgi:hypothetical protein
MSAPSYEQLAALVAAQERIIAQLQARLGEQEARIARQDPGSSSRKRGSWSWSGSWLPPRATPPSPRRPTDRTSLRRSRCAASRFVNPAVGRASRAARCARSSGPMRRSSRARLLPWLRRHAGHRWCTGQGPPAAGVRPPDDHRAFGRTPAGVRRCSCGTVTQAARPAGVSAPVQYGPHAAAIAVYLVLGQHRPVVRTAGRCWPSCSVSRWRSGPWGVGSGPRGSSPARPGLRRAHHQRQGRRDPCLVLRAAFGGNSHAIMRPDGLSISTSPVVAGHDHGLTCARNQHLHGALSWAAPPIPLARLGSTDMLLRSSCTGTDRPRSLGTLDGSFGFGIGSGW